MISLERIILHVLLAASWATTAVSGQKSALYTGWTYKFDGTPYPTQTVRVGDSITFIWTINEVQNVFIHPTNDCTQTGRVAIGNVSPTEYVFKEEDAGKSLFFANDIDDRCENYGMKLIANVLPLEQQNVPGIPGVSLTPAPTEDPVFFFETPSPTVAPTAAPVAKAATAAPTIATTMFPTAVPMVPTDAPVVPTDAPVVPTDAPVVPTDAPVTPTDAPVVPTDAPIAPTAPPTITPTTPPNPLPTRPPTPLPTTGQPTSYPTTWNPTGSPTRDTGDDVTRVTMRGLQMTLAGIDSFSDQTKKAWTDETQTFSSSHYEDDIEGGSFRTSIAVTNFFASPQSRQLLVRGGEQRQRQLQEEIVVVTYNQVVSYSNTGDAEISEEYFAKSAFAFPEQRDNYVKALQGSNDPVLEATTDSSPVTFVSENVPTSAPVTTQQPQPSPDPNPKSSKLTTPEIIGIACGGAAVLIIAILFCIYCKATNPKDESSEADSPTPPRKISIKEDEVSTLAGPSIADNPAGYGDRSLDDTVDYDYSKAYGNGEHSVSSAGGTFGTNTQNIDFPMNAGATGAALGPYGDDGSYQDHFRNSEAGKVKEEILHIFAPPGKLGVVIDTPDDGAPVVHAVKDTSVVVDKVQVGDKLVAVDDEDVRTLTAIKVSKLISRKSANPSRKLTILRLTHVG